MPEFWDLALSQNGLPGHLLVEMDEIKQLRRDSGALLRIARSVLRDAHGAEDAVQDAWLAAAQQSDRVGPGWLRTVVRRGALRRRRRAGSRPVEASLEQVAEPTAPMGRAEAALRVAAAIQALPADYRDVIERRFWDDQPPRAIAKALRIEPKAVRNRLHRALAQLREELGAESGGLGLWVVLAQPKGAQLPVAEAAASGGVSLGSHGGSYGGAWLVGLAVLAVGAALTVHLESGERQPNQGALSSALISASEASAPSELESPELVQLAAQGPRERVEQGIEVPSGPKVEEQVSGPHTKDGNHDVLTVSIGHLRVAAETPGSSEAPAPFTVTLLGGSSPLRLSSEALEQSGIPVGSYEGFLQLNRWEVAELGAVGIRAGEVTDLGVVRLSPGSGVVRGRVLPPRRLAGASLSLSLSGSGRSEGACCAPEGAEGPADAAVHCGTCGLGEASSVLELLPPYEFIFDRLTSGPQRLVLSAGGEGVLATRELALERGEERSIELDVSLGAIEVLLVDATGRPFEGGWVEDSVLYAAPITFQAWASDLVVAVAQAEPPPFGAGVTVGGVLTQVVSGDLPANTAKSTMGARGAALWPKALPRPRDLELPPRRVTATGQGRFRIEDVPGEVTAIQIACGPFVTEIQTLPDPADHPGPLRILIDHRCGLPSAQLTSAENLTCVSCHVQSY